MNHPAIFWATCLFMVFILPAIDASTRLLAEESPAETVLASGDVQGGLCVIVGCDDDKPAAKIAQSGPFLVQCLCSHRRIANQMRTAVAERGIYGTVSVDCYSPGRLPYAENLVNLLIVHDMQASPAGKLSVAEVLRVLAPGGVACLNINPGTTGGLSRFSRRENGTVPFPNPVSSGGNKVWMERVNADLRAAGIEKSETISASGNWIKFVKPWPKDIDHWTHWLHGADGNAVAMDRRVGPPRHLQWIGNPLWSRSHETVPSVSAMVSANGRLFSIVDEAPPAIDGRLPDKWSLVARDAFNGVELWRIPMPDWGWKQWSAKWFARFNQPTNLPRRLVAVDDTVYVTLGFEAPVTALDAATGKVKRTYAGTELTDAILYHEGRLILSQNKQAPKPDMAAAARRSDSPAAVSPKKQIHVVNAETGETIWKQGDYLGLRSKTASVEPFTHLTAAVGDDRVFFAEPDSLHCLDLATGKELWRIPRPDAPEITMRYDIRISDMCTLVYSDDLVSDGLVLFAQLHPVGRIGWEANPGTLHAFSAETGKQLWQRSCAAWGWATPADVFVIDGLVWIHEKESYAALALDPATGEVKRRFSTDKVFKVGHHHRCYRNKATERFMLTSRRGVEMIDIENEDCYLHHWARGACRFGVVPCNGLLYTTPHPCDCYIATSMNGFTVLAGEIPAGERPADIEPADADPPGRIEYGAAYVAAGAVVPEATADEWPTWRHDPQRSCSTRASLPDKLKPLWKAEVGGRLSGCTVARGKVFVASIDRHCVHALDADTGKAAWRYTTGGRIDTPPTIAGDLALFGSADGWVYCLRAADGQLMWRFHAAAADRQVGIFGQLESAWPVHGNVLVKDGKVYCTAGRSTFLDGGIRAYVLDARSGKLLQQRTIYSPDPETGRMIPGGDWKSIPGARSDVLVGQGGAVYMRQLQLWPDPRQAKPAGAHLLSTAGFLDNAWFNRTSWSLGKRASGQLLVFDDECAYTVQAFSSIGRQTIFRPGEKGYRLFAVERDPQGAGNVPKTRTASKGKKSAAGRWSVRIPIRAAAMLVAGDRLLVAGQPDIVDPNDPLGAFEGRKGGLLWSVSTKDGKKLAEYKLADWPAANGMAAAGGKLYIATNGGKLICFAAEGKNWGRSFISH